MLLFSTILDVNDNNYTEEDFPQFIQMLIDSNPEHPDHPEKTIPLDKIQWDHKRLENDFAYENLSLKTIEYKNGKIMAARFEKEEENGMSWQTDYVWNLDEKKIAIRLSRTYRDDATTQEQTFYPPSFIHDLIEGEFLKDDNGLPISEDPIVIGRDQISLLTDAVNGKVNYKFPIVYVSKKLENNQDPVNVKELAQKLRGVAHVFVEEDNELDVEIAHKCEDKHTFGGAVTVYYPNKVFNHQTINRYNGRESNPDAFINKILDLVLYYMNRIELPPLYTWDSVKRQITEDQLAHNREERWKNEVSWQKAETEADENRKLLDDAQNQVDILTNENQLYMELTKDVDAELTLKLGEEKGYLVGEVKEVVLEALEEKMHDYKDVRKRRYSILKSIVEANETPQILKEMYEEVKTIENSCHGKIRGKKRELNKLFITEGTDGDGHPGFVYHERQEYFVPLPSTGGDKKKGGHGAGNAADEIKKVMF